MKREQFNRFNFLGEQVMKMMEPFQFVQGAGNKNEVTVSIFIWQ
jgi:hypothetical protein